MLHLGTSFGKIYCQKLAYRRMNISNETKIRSGRRQFYKIGD